MSSNALSLPLPAESRTVNWARFGLLGTGTVVAAVVANTLFYFLGSGLVDYDPEFVVLADVGGTIIFTLVAAIVAVLLYAALLRFTHHPARIFTIISAVVFVVTLIPDFAYIPTVPGSTNPQTAILAMMHVVAACVIVRVLTLSDRSPTR
jgi:tryptophan-rich sensory protein